MKNPKHLLVSISLVHHITELLLCLQFIVFYGVSNAQAQISNPDVLVPDCARTSYNSQQVAQGTELYCYECKETYTKSYDPGQSPCRHNLSQITVRQCSAADRYCKVERLDILKFNTVLMVQRGCVNECPYGCRYNGLGLTYMRCTSCCNTPGCNVGNMADRKLTVSHLLLVGVLALGVCVLR